MTWPAPRYEADEFAAGFVASIKAAMYERAVLRAGTLERELRPDDLNAGGNVRLASRWNVARLCSPCSPS
jgi:hypothetical protein